MMNNNQPKMRRNREFEAAFDFVSEHFFHLSEDDRFQGVRLVVTGDHFLGGRCYGAFYSNNGAPYITVRNARVPATEYVDTLVHELTHLQQYLSGRAATMSDRQSEAEAEAAGCAARKLAAQQWPDGWAF